MMDWELGLSAYLLVSKGNGSETGGPGAIRYNPDARWGPSPANGVGFLRFKRETGAQHWVMNGNSTNGNGTCSAIRECFRCCAHRISLAVGSPWAFLVALTAVIVWGMTGPLFKFSDTWQLVINTATTIITFLMVFIIQNTQNRDTKAIHLKLDELLRGVKGARTSMVNLENMSDEELDRLQKEFERLRGDKSDARTKNGHARKASNPGNVQRSTSNAQPSSQRTE
jgi:low affinity Fe/Cu permease